MRRAGLGISLVNFSGKIISKILATRLSKILPDIIDDEHPGFIQVRHISTYIAWAQGLVQKLSRKVYGLNVVFKLDMAKAYDQPE